MKKLIVSEIQKDQERKQTIDGVEYELITTEEACKSMLDGMDRITQRIEELVKENKKLKKEIKEAKVNNR